MSESDALPRLATARLIIRHSEPTDAAEVLEFFVRNREHFRPWDPPPAPNFYTEAFWSNGLARSLEEFFADRAVRFHFYLRAVDARDDGRLVGRANYSQVFRGPFQSCMLGYQVDREFEGRGLMREGLEATIQYMFAVRRLHRIQANYIEENQRSAHLLTRLHFAREGLARDYLNINGRWRDHVLTARLNPDFPLESVVPA